MWVKYYLHGFFLEEMNFGVIRVKFEFWLKNLAEIPCYRHPQERMRNYNS